MNAYIYQADIYCVDCGEAIKRRVERDTPANVPANPNDERTFDSDDYPKGPYTDGGGEADCPQHCGMCRVHLENPLTRDGEQYVLRAINSECCTIPEWREYYSYLFA
jgi:hypothetical protein